MVLEIGIAVREILLFSCLVELVAFGCMNETAELPLPKFAHLFEALFVGRYACAGPRGTSNGVEVLHVFALASKLQKTISRVRAVDTTVTKGEVARFPSSTCDCCFVFKICGVTPVPGGTAWVPQRRELHPWRPGILWCHTGIGLPSTISAHSVLDQVARTSVEGLGPNRCDSSSGHTENTREIWNVRRVDGCVNHV